MSLVCFDLQETLDLIRSQKWPTKLCIAFGFDTHNQPLHTRNFQQEPRKYFTKQINSKMKQIGGENTDLNRIHVPFPPQYHLNTHEQNKQTRNYWGHSNIDLQQNTPIQTHDIYVITNKEQ